MHHDQADELRQLVRERAQQISASGSTPLVVVTGGKDGVGTTTVALNLAVALARRGRRPLFIDADLCHGGHVQLGQQSPRGSVVDVLEGRASLLQVMQRGYSGIQTVSGRWAVEQDRTPTAAMIERFIAELRQLSPQVEIAVIDAGSNRGTLVRELWHAAQAVLAVTTTEQTAMMECYAAIKVLAGTDTSIPLYALVNRALDGPFAGEIHGRIAEAARKFLGLAVAAAPHVTHCDADTAEALVFPARCEAARAMDRLADTLWARLPQGARGSERMQCVMARSA